MDFEKVWQSILAHAGDTFAIANGETFTYTAFPNYIICSRALTRNLSRKNFEKAYNTLGKVTPTEFNRTIQGSSYVKAILTDARIG